MSSRYVSITIKYGKSQLLKPRAFCLKQAPDETFSDLFTRSLGMCQPPRYTHEFELPKVQVQSKGEEPITCDLKASALDMITAFDCNRIVFQVPEQEIKEIKMEKQSAMQIMMQAQQGATHMLDLFPTSMRLTNLHKLTNHLIELFIEKNCGKKGFTLSELSKQNLRRSKGNAAVRIGVARYALQSLANVLWQLQTNESTLKNRNCMIPEVFDFAGAFFTSKGHRNRINLSKLLEANRKLGMILTQSWTERGVWVWFRTAVKHLHASVSKYCNYLTSQNVRQNYTKTELVSDTCSFSGGFYTFPVDKLPQKREKQVSRSLMTPARLL